MSLNQGDGQLVGRKRTNNNIKEHIVLKRVQLNRILSLVETLEQIETKEKKMKQECNFYNRGFCNRGLDCTFSQPQELHESFERTGAVRTENAEVGISTAGDTLTPDLGVVEESLDLSLFP